MKNAKELALLAARALSDKKGKEIQVLEIGELTTLADYFVIATGSSNTQINALCGSPAPGGLPWRHVGAAGLRLHRRPCL